MINKIIIFILIVLLIKYFFYQTKLLDNTFYDYKEIYPELNQLKMRNIGIKQEVINIINDDWKIWPEKNLYKKNNGWKVLPFYGFGHWIKKNCDKCPIIFNIIKNIPGLKTASLSRLAPGTKIEPHYGWAKLSNYVLRCQYGIICGEKCIIGCEDDVVVMTENKIIVFDDSKLHYAQNNGSKDRIILILDIDRPKNVKIGTSTVEDTAELNNFIDSIK